MENYLSHQKFPEGILQKAIREILEEPARSSNCKWATDVKMLMVTDKQRKIDIIHDSHQALGNNVKVVATSSHLGRTSTYRKVSSRLYWYAIVNDVADYIKGSDKKKLKKN